MKKVADYIQSPITLTLYHLILVIIFLLTGYSLQIFFWGESIFVYGYFSAALISGTLYFQKYVKNNLPIKNKTAINIISISLMILWTILLIWVNVKDIS
ncbi:MAG: hypothetical protein WCJ58_05355 [bacterium]